LVLGTQTKGRVPRLDFGVEPFTFEGDDEVEGGLDKKVDGHEDPDHVGSEGSGAMRKKAPKVVMSVSANSQAVRRAFMAMAGLLAPRYWPTRVAVPMAKLGRKERDSTRMAMK